MSSPGARLLSMAAYREDPRRVWRRVALALLVSLGVHAAAFTELPVIGQDPGPTVSGPPLAARIVTAPKAVPEKVARAPKATPARPRARPAAPEPAAVERAEIPQPAPEVPAPVVQAAAESAEPPAVIAEAAQAAPIPPAPAAAQPKGVAEATLNVVPEFAQIDFDLSKGGSQYIGRVTHVWQRNGAQYEVRSVTEASGLMSLFFSGRLVQESKGTVGEGGLRPDRFTVQRGREDRLESASFDWATQTGTLAGRGNPRNWALQAGTQDQLSFLYQLAYLVNREGARRVAVTNARGIDTAAFEILGEESIETGAGGLVALHVRSRLGNEGGTVEVWLSTQHQYLPVKIRLRDKRGEEAEQVASAIRLR